MALTDLWFILPDWAWRLVLRLAGVSQADAHEWLCEVWSCRCG